MANVSFDVDDRKIPRDAILFPVRVFSATQAARIQISELIGEANKRLDLFHDVELEIPEKSRKPLSLNIDGVRIGDLSDEDSKSLRSAIAFHRVSRVHHLEAGETKEPGRALSVLCVVVVFVFYPSPAPSVPLAEPLPETDIGDMAYIAKVNRNLPRSAIGYIPKEQPANASKFTAKLAGVTFANDDGSSRQHFLEQIYEREPPFEAPAAFMFYFDGYLFEGEPAVQIMVNGCCIGNISRADLPTVTRALEEKRILSVRELQVQPFVNSDGQEVYSAKLILNLEQGTAFAPGAVPKKKAEPDNVAHCPECGSPSVVACRKRWNHLLAILGLIIGMALTALSPMGLFGILFGFIGKGGYRRCLNCNHRWK